MPKEYKFKGKDSVTLSSTHPDNVEQMAEEELETIAGGYQAPFEGRDPRGLGLEGAPFVEGRDPRGLGPVVVPESSGGYEPIPVDPNSDSPASSRC
ncbi:hypothetical protein SAMD00079811_79130 (plasmid) [Scytonema sp. HK-05]|uniref:hypothetical protein n=1 Tax=Scytonema sp. HK-05 TaxID=1137095 RepID=UPI00093570DC|nr:hypothetical protein [Scytonema sp. HK-05]OKH57080.1 hypothetical protein NIES2130_21835 [Scytonema sp. HK-05]BAY50284.1 hypothetical protein SAMD00079811_79130 [Scytonema sp. HK-05]